MAEKIQALVALGELNSRMKDFFDRWARGTYIRVRVKDNGRGMSAEVARRIFDPFFTTKGKNGTGLGLPQVRAFMRLIGGYVSVRSKPGLGTSFELLLPAAEPDGADNVQPDA